MSEGINLLHFQHVLSTSFQVSFCIRFSQIWDAIWGSVWHHFSEKTNGSENSFKKGSPNMKTPPYEHVRGAPREAFSREHFSNKKQQFDFEMLFEFGSFAFFSRICSKMLFELTSIANVPKTSSNKCKGSVLKTHY